MTRKGLEVARAFGDALPTYRDQTEAEASLFARRDSALAALVTEVGATVRLDYSLDSLDNVEQWYFDRNCPDVGGSGYSVAHALAAYFGEVLCRVGGYRWIVDAYVFKAGRYELGITNGQMTVMLTGGIAAMPGSARRKRSLWPNV